MRTLKDTILEKLSVDNIKLVDIPEYFKDYDNRDSINTVMGMLQGFATKNGYMISFKNKKTKAGDFTIPIYEYNGIGKWSRKAIMNFYGNWSNAPDSPRDRNFKECYFKVIDWIRMNSRAIDR